MNYFAHGYRYLDRPWFLAGTAVPDWLSVADRRVRLDRESVERLSGAGNPEAELAAGVLQHLEDDRWFHRNPAFVEVCRGVTEHLREALGRRNGYRLSFFGHVATEVLLDGVLIENQPERLGEYYATLAEIDAGLVEDVVNEVAKGSTARLAPFVRRFREAEFLRDYGDDESLLFRLNQVMGRIGLEQLPGEAAPVLAAARRAVRERMPELLPPRPALADR